MTLKLLSSIPSESVPVEAEELWATLENVPVGDDDCILETFNGFEVGTTKFEIWLWFEETYPVMIDAGCLIDPHDILREIS